MPTVDAGLTWTIVGVALTLGFGILGVFVALRGRSTDGVGVSNNSSEGPMVAAVSPGQQVVTDRSNLGLQVNVGPGGQATVSAGAGLFQDAYRRHLDDLLDIAKAIQEATDEPNPKGILPDGGGPTKMLLEALRKHIPSSPLWQAVDDWHQASVSLATLQQEIRVRIEQMVDAARAAMPGVVNKEGFVASLWVAADCTARNQSLSHMTYAPESGAGEVGFRWGGFGITKLKAGPPVFERVQQAHQQLVQQIGADNSTVKLRDSLLRWDKAPKTIKDEADHLLLGHFLPGDCDLCPPKSQ